MVPVQFELVCSKLRCSEIAPVTLETLPGKNDINTQMQIRSIISAPVLHPTIAPPPISADINIYLHSEVTELATNLANGGSIDHFMLPQGILDQVDNDEKKTLLERKLQKCSDKKLHREAQIQFQSKHNNSTAIMTYNSTAVAKR